MKKTILFSLFLSALASNSKAQCPTFFNFSFTVTACTCTNSTNGEVFADATGGTAPYTYQWSANAASQIGQTASNLGADTYTVTVTDDNGCVDDGIVTVGSISPEPIEICLVTTDAQSVYNHVYWEKTGLVNVDSFIVYREVSPGNFTRIGAVSNDSMSMYKDTARSIGPANGNPNTGAYRYKLQVKDVCGNLGPMSLYHATLHIHDDGLGSFSWTNPYEIEGTTNPVTSYILLCDTINTDTWVPVNTVSGTQSSAIDPNFATHASTANWRVKTAWGITCNPTRATINTTRSNIKGAQMMTGVNNELLAHFIIVFPNPASTAITVQQPQFQQPSTIALYNSLGALVYKTSSSNSSETINIENLAKGIYTVSVQTQSGTVFKKLIIQ